MEKGENNRWNLILLILGRSKAASLAIGLACIISGTVLLIHGALGSPNWATKIISSESQITDAMLGVASALIGLFIVIVAQIDKPERLSPWLKFSEMAVLLVGAYLAIDALNVYKNQASIAFNTNIQDLESEVLNLEITKPHLAALYAEPEQQMHGLEAAHYLVNLYLDCTVNEQKSCDKFIRHIEGWKDVKDLDCALYEISDFKNPAKRKLREGYLYAESILYLVARAFEGKQTKKSMKMNTNNTPPILEMLAITHYF